MAQLLIDAIHVCPLCRKRPLNARSKPLYRGTVCHKCLYSFLNRRQGAYLLDCFLLWLIVAAIQYGMVHLGVNVLVVGFTFVPIFSVSSFAIFLVESCVFYLKDGYRGKSFGKLVTGLTVVDETSRESITFARSFRRNLPILIPFGSLIMLHQIHKGFRMGDRWANTRVVWDKYRHRFPFEDRGHVCFTCGYDLTGNISGICPECGNAVTTALAPAPIAAPIAKPVGNPGQSSY